MNRNYRKMFPILQNKVMLSSCSQSAISNKVFQAMDLYQESLLNDGMDWTQWMKKVNDVKEKFATLINCDPDEVAILSSVSDCVSSILNALDLHNKEVIATELDFPCIGQALLAQKHKQDFTLTFIPQVNYTIPLSSYSNYLTEHTTLTCIPHVSYYNGFKQDLKAISNIVHEKGSLLLVDAYQSVGSTNIDVKEMNIDILVTGMQKYLLGIPGISLMYIKRELADSLQPSTIGWFGQENPFDFNLTELKYAESAQRFNTGTPPIVNAYVADAALDIILEIGIHSIQKYLKSLSQHTIDTALHLGLSTHSPKNVDEKSPCTAVCVENASEVEQILKEKNIIVSARKDVIRIAPHFYNTKEDITTTLETLRQII